ncbi:methyltransferase [Streptomyces sp. NPDC007095]|uniref:methyltransferase n=1 Tax=Streptomyces sp. NPDC007095 TaxID=3154482 RepID=UPI0033DA6AE9
MTARPGRGCHERGVGCCGPASHTKGNFQVSTDRERVIATAPDPVVRQFLRMADDSIVAVLPFALSVAARLAIADECAGAGRSVKDLAQVLNAAPDPLERLMRALVSCGFFTEDADGLFALAPLGQLLRTDSPVSLRATLSNLDTYRAWLGAVETISTGSPSFDSMFGTPFFSHKEQDDGAGVSFDERMHERASRLYAGLAVLPDWHGVSCLLDIGGGRGTVLASVLEENPDLRGILFDRSDVIERSATSGTLEPFEARCRLVGGDFFAGLPGGADAHLMCSVLHDWDDEDAVRILTRSREALPEGGRIFLCEMILPESTEPHPAYWSDLGMMVLLGGRERSYEQYQTLLRAAGLRAVKVTPLPGSSFGVIEARGARS